MIISVGRRAEGEAFVKVLPFSYLGRRELDESEKRLSCIPNKLGQVLPVSKKPRAKELEKKKSKARRQSLEKEIYIGQHIKPSLKYKPGLTYTAAVSGLLLIIPTSGCDPHLAEFDPYFQNY